MKPAYLLILFCALSCAKSPKDFDEFGTNCIISLKTTPQTLKANGYDTLLVEVTIDRKTKEDKQQINLSTTAGTFVSSNGTTAIVKPDADGKVKVPLLAPTVPAVGYISAEVGGFKQTVTVVFGEADVNTVISLDVPSGIDADGVSTGNIQVTVPKGLALTQRTIAISTTAGTFINSGNNSVSVKPNADGIVLVPLRAPVGPVKAYVTAELGAYKQTKELMFNSVDADKLLKIEGPSTPIEADGFSPVNIIIKSIPNADGSQRSVTLSTTAGTFASTGTNTATTKLNLNNEIVVTLKAPSVAGMVYVSADVNPFKQTTVLQFVPAYAEQVTVDAGTFSLRAGLDQQTTVTAQLLRSKGTASANVAVQFTAYDSTGTRTLNQGNFRSMTLSDATGKATAVYTPGNTTYRGKTIIQASVTTPSGVHKGQDQVLIVNP